MNTTYRYLLYKEVAGSGINPQLLQLAVLSPSTCGELVFNAMEGDVNRPKTFHVTTQEGVDELMLYGQTVVLPYYFDPAYPERVEELYNICFPPEGRFPHPDGDTQLILRVASNALTDQLIATILENLRDLGGNAPCVAMGHQVDIDGKLTLFSRQELPNKVVTE